MYGFGSTHDMELGIQAEEGIVTAPILIPLLSGINVTNIFPASTSLHSFAVTESGRVIAMGPNEHGQCCFTDAEEKGIQTITGLNPFKTVDYASLGYFFSILVMKDLHTAMPVKNVSSFRDVIVCGYN
jgi:alpha-tubulin suppressor-like RCC1 family protein